MDTMQVVDIERGGVTDNINSPTTAMGVIMVILEARVAPTNITMNEICSYGLSAVTFSILFGATVTFLVDMYMK